MPKAKSDVTVANEGTVWQFLPLTRKGKAWVEENLNLQSWQWLGKTFSVEHRYGESIVNGMRGDGLVVGPQDN